MKYRNKIWRWAKWGKFFLILIFYTASSQQNITQLEYYIDKDSGYGKANAVSITPAQNLTDVSFTYNISSLLPGLHVIGVRSKDANGAWSLDERWLFLKPSAPASPGNIAKLEFYIDKDPGYGKAISALGFSPVQDVANFSIPFNIDTLSAGLHIIGLRSQDANSQWSMDERWIFLKPFATAVQSNITKVEFYIDKDPGYGKATSASGLSPALDVANLSLSFNIDTLTSGLHIIGVRSQDAAGQWSLDERWMLLKPSAQASQSNITKAEFYIDKDPGYGNAISAAGFSAGQDVSNISVPFNIDTLSAGLHIIGTRSQDADGKWSLDEKWLFIKQDTTPALPNIVRVEYYVDGDPGFGKASPVSFTPATNLIDLPFAQSISQENTNVHKICVRSKDAKGAWSLDQCWLFNSGTILPVNFIQFTATGEKDKVRLFWSTASELNSKEFLVRRSLDGFNYETIGTVSAAGNSTAVKNYYYDDYNAMQFKGKKVYYQLLQKDIDGQGKYTDIKIVTIKNSLNYLQLAYNPVKNEAILKYESSANNEVLIRVIDASGRMMKLVKTNVKAGFNQISLNVSTLLKGIYEVEVINNKDSQQVKMMKQ